MPAAAATDSKRDDDSDKKDENEKSMGPTHMQTLRDARRHSRRATFEYVLILPFAEQCPYASVLRYLAACNDFSFTQNAFDGRRIMIRDLDSVLTRRASVRVQDIAYQRHVSSLSQEEHLLNSHCRLLQRLQ